MDKAHIGQIIQELAQIGGDSLRLPLPRRASLAPVLALRKALWAHYWDPCCDIASKELNTSEMLHHLKRLPGFEAHFAAMGQDKAGIISNLLIMRHMMAKGSILTVSEPLSRMLSDTNVNPDIPARFFVAPFRTCYVEFHPAECREKSDLPLISTGIGAMAEGCYIQERQYDKLPTMSQETVEFLELDRQAPVRILEIGFTASPFNNPDVDTKMPVVMDAIDFATIYIQDEDEPLNAMLERHFEMYARQRTGTFLQLNQQDDFRAYFKHCFEVLTRILFYLHIERKQQREEKPASELEKRLSAVADKKKNKIIKQINRTYDRIVIGPDHYVSLADRIESEATAGKKRPHYRRATIGIRWIGSGKEKRPELRRIKESIVNAHMMSADNHAPRDYLIK